MFMRDQEQEGGLSGRPFPERRQHSPWRRHWVAVCLFTFLLVTSGGWRLAGWLERVEYQSTCSYWWSNRDVTGYVSPEDHALGKGRYMQVCMAREREQERLHLASSDPDNHVCKWQDGAGCPPNPDLRVPWLIFMEFVGLGVLLRWKRKRRTVAGWRAAILVGAIPVFVHVFGHLA